MAQTAFLVLPSLLIYIRDLLKTGMKVTAYNHHAATTLLGSEGADAVM
jgi:hypothetical protein